MADLDRRYAQGTTVGRTEAGVVDQGLRAYMIRVYNYMATGVAITGVLAYAIYALSVQQGAGRSRADLVRHLHVREPVQMGGDLRAARAGVLHLGAHHSMSLGAAQTSFWVFAALMGASISSIFLVYAGQSIARVFFITAASFGALSLWGYTTNRDLTGWGSFLFMGLIGIILASLVNMFIASTALQFADLGDRRAHLRRLHRLRHAADQGDVLCRRRRLGRRPQGMMGALRLYLDFINLFMLLLQLFGDRR